MAVGKQDLPDAERQREHDSPAGQVLHHRPGERAGGILQEAQRVADLVNYIADTEPISARGIGEGLTRFSSAMSMAGNTLEQSIALLTASTAVTQDPAKSANDWRTISMRIRGKVLCLHTGKVRMRCCA